MNYANKPFSHKETLHGCHVHKCSWLGSIFDKKHKMWDQLTTFWSLDRAEKHYRLKEQPLNMPLGSQNPYAKRAYPFTMVEVCVYFSPSRWRCVL